MVELVIVGRVAIPDVIESACKGQGWEGKKNSEWALLEQRVTSMGGTVGRQLLNTSNVPLYHILT